MNRRVAAVLLAAGAIACGQAIHLSKPEPPTLQPVRPMAVHTCVPDAKVWLDGAGVPPELEAPRSADASGAVTYLIFPGTIADFNVHASAPNHDEYGVVVHQVALGSSPVDLFVGDCEKESRAGYTTAIALAAWPPIVLPLPPLPSKADFIHHYQGDFGNAKLAGCGFFNDAVFDPILLVKWLDDRPCFEAAMKLKAANGDNRVVVDPRADYHGGQGGRIVDFWHDPQQLRPYLEDIRRHTNRYGEHFEVTLFNVADGHIGSLVKSEGVPDLDAEAHAIRDIQALAAAVGDQIAATAVCWECRHQRDYITPGGYERIGKAIAAAFPNAFHAMHLIQGSSSWSSWNCDPAQGDPACTPAAANMEGDDPNRGSEPVAWERCLRDGWCDGFYYQFHSGDQYVHPDDYENLDDRGDLYAPPGALGRWWEVVVRLGDDPQSLATSGGNRHGWRQVPVLAFEFIYDGYSTPPGRAIVGNRSPAEYAIDWCKRALALGGWGCGSASYRR